MNKFFELWASLSLAERLRLYKFALSPYFNDTTWFAPLVKAVAELAVDTDFAAATDLDKRIFKAVFAEASTKKSKEFDTQRYNRLLSDATRFVLRFLQVERLPPPDTAAIWLEQRLPRRYEAAAAQTQQALLAQPLRDSTHYATRLKYEKLGLEHAQSEQIRTNRNNLEVLHQALDVYFLAEKLRYICEVLNHQNILQHTYTIEGVAEIMQWLQTSSYRNEPPIAVYLNVYDLLTLKTAGSFDRLKGILEEYGTHFSHAELKELYTYCINFCIRQVNSGDERYAVEYLNLIEVLLHNKVLFVAGELGVARYKNTVAIGLRAGEYDKTAHFIRNYSQFLPAERRENAITYNMAQLHFAKAEQERNSEAYQKEAYQKENYQKVLTFLRDVDYDNVFYALDSRWLLLKTYYALNEMLVLEGTMQSFRAYLLRNTTISAYTKQQYLELISLFKKLAALPQKKKETAAALYAKIEAKDIVADKKWLLRQVALFM
ncbi:MAG: hypothetical protein RI894_1682 [Bacteroidota bacterium]|jgi:hypothetical protein